MNKIIILMASVIAMNVSARDLTVAEQVHIKEHCSAMASLDVRNGVEKRHDVRDMLVRTAFMGVFGINSVVHAHYGHAGLSAASFAAGTAGAIGMPKSKPELLTYEESYTECASSRARVFASYDQPLMK